MELMANVLEGLLHWQTNNGACLNFPRASVNDLVPFRFGALVHRVVQAGNELAGQERPVLFG